MTNAERRKLLNEYRLSDRKESLLDMFSNYRKMQDGGQKDPSKDKGDYNMARAEELGYTPEDGHWPSVDYTNGMWLKSAKHPTAVKELLHGYLGADVYKTNDLVTNPEGYFGEDQLQYIPKRQPAPRMGVRQNPGGSVSTHKYATETLDGKNWFSFPTLFQNPDSSWVDMEPEEGDDWYPAYEEALRRGEVIDFGEDKKGALEWGEGSWKEQKQTGGPTNSTYTAASDNTRVSTPISPQVALNPATPTPMVRDEGTIRQRPYDSMDFWRDVKTHNSQDDSTFENAVEAFDPTGVSSWDDAYRAWNSMQDRGASYPNLDEAVDMLGAVPMLGKAKFTFNLAKKAQKPLKYYGIEFYNNVGRHVINSANALDALEDETGFLDSKKYGGTKKYFERKIRRK